MIIHMIELGGLKIVLLHLDWFEQLVVPTATRLE